jgi:ApbE superfamily uncharacterized protein (UPF0280 family)
VTVPLAALLPGNRLHLQHGPIDLVIGAEGERDKAFAAARKRFETILEELVAELPLLRREVGNRPRGAVARRMHAAVLPLAAYGFITPMAAVAGAVAQEVLEAMLDHAELARAFVNNGGDIALHLAQGQSYRIAVRSPANRELGTIHITAADPVRGIATSGWGGRSFSLGIADAVTVLAKTAAEADAAATVIANRVDLPGHRAITREPANMLQPDSDLGDRLVTTHVGSLTPGECEAALAAGALMADEFIGLRRVEAAALFLNDAAIARGRTQCLANLDARSKTHA